MTHFKLSLSGFAMCGRSLAVVIAAGAALAVAGCRHSSDAGAYPSEVQVVDAAYGPEAISASAGGKSLSDWVPYGQASGMTGVEPGNYAVDITLRYRNGAPGDLGASSLSVDGGRRYTAVEYAAVGRNTDADERSGHFALFSVPKRSDADRQNAERSGRAEVRVFNAAVGAQRVDVLVNSIVAFKSVAYGHRSDSIPLAALPYEWTVKPAGDSVDDYGPPTTLQLKGGRDYVVVILGSVADNDLQIKAVEE